jgi:lipopolysaccharide export system protein LptC
MMSPKLQPAPSRSTAQVVWMPLREALASYLPIVMMVLLALATWWLVKNSPQPAAPAVERAVTHDPDYAMRGALLQRFDRDGVLRLQIEGDRMRHFPDTDAVEVDVVRIRAYAPDGSVTVATAKRAVAQSDGSDVQLMGGARVEREASGSAQALLFQSEFLHAFLDARLVKSHLPVTLRAGNSELRAAGFSYDDNTQVMQLQGPVRAQWVTALKKPAAPSASPPTTPPTKPKP